MGGLTNLAFLASSAKTSGPTLPLPRALPNAPDGYKPTDVACPLSRPTVRSASTLSQGEQDFLRARRNVTMPAMQDFLQRVNISGFNVTSYFNTHSSNTSSLPSIGIAVSGGGYRALLNGAGAIQAFDSREVDGGSSGHLGGLLQSSTYLSGLSGGSWLVGSIYVNNFTTISDLLAPIGSQWEFQNSIFAGPDRGIDILTSADYFTTIYNEVQGKSNGYNTTITDYWGRALSFQLINDTNGGPSYTWSSIALQDGYSAAQFPFPIVIADERAPGELVIPSNTTIFEFNPLELGTWDPTTYGFMPLEYLGTNFTNGAIVGNEPCVRGFDNAGYVMGTSSSLFNSILLRINNTNAPSVVASAIAGLLTKTSSADYDIAAYEPNPFLDYNPTGKSKNAAARQLTLVDGGTDGQNIPLQPLIQPLRKLDVIFAVDSSADTTLNWPNGVSLVSTYERSLNNTVGVGIGNGTSFPSIPDTNTFVNLGLNARPTFFGCNASNTTSVTPLIVYLPNAPYTYFSNVSTFDPSYNTSQRDAIVLNGYNVATLGNGSADSEWPVCVGCAIMSRSLERTGTAVPSACQQCFVRYCWNGTVNATAPSTNYAPGLVHGVSANATGGSGSGSGSGSGGSTTNDANVFRANSLRAIGAAVLAASTILVI